MCLDPDASGPKEAFMPFSENGFDPVPIPEHIVASRSAGSALSIGGVYIDGEQIIDKGIPVLQRYASGLILICWLRKQKIIPRRV